jgi:molybdate transport system ATP-binding protein
MIDVNIVLERKHFNVEIAERFHNGITGIFGQSGAGKTSLLQAVAGLARPRGGCIVSDGRVLFDAARHINLPIEQRNVGYVFQEGRLFPHLTVEKNLRYGMKKGRERRAVFDEVVALLKLDHLLGCRPRAISGGERQRTALGRALLSSPDMLLLDEPFSAVDMPLRRQILPFIRKVQQTFHLPTLVVSHDLPDLLKLTRTLCIIHEGRCIGHGDCDSLRKIPECVWMIGAPSPLTEVESYVSGSSELTESSFPTTHLNIGKAEREPSGRCGIPQSHHDAVEKGVNRATRWDTVDWAR